MSRTTWKKFAVVGAMLALALTPMMSQASHCADVFVFTGPTDQVPPNSQTSGHVNLGVAGCAAATAEVSTNIVTPGSAFVRVGALGTAAQVASNGSISFNGGAPIALTFTHNGSRWNSQLLAIPAGTTTISATATTTNSPSGAKTQTVTYRTLGS